MLLHDVEEAVALLGQRGGPLLGAAGQLLEEIGDDVVQTGAAARAHHGVCEITKGGDCGALPAIPWGRDTRVGAQGNTTSSLSKSFRTLQEPTNPEQVSDFLADIFTISNVPALTAVKLLRPFRRYVLASPKLSLPSKPNPKRTPESRRTYLVQ